MIKILPLDRFPKGANYLQGQSCYHLTDNQAIIQKINEDIACNLIGVKHLSKIYYYPLPKFIYGFVVIELNGENNFYYSYFKSTPGRFSHDVKIFKLAVKNKEFVKGRFSVKNWKLGF